jgi:hypothetical protein
VVEFFVEVEDVVVTPCGVGTPVVTGTVEAADPPRTAVDSWVSAAWTEAVAAGVLLKLVEPVVVPVVEVEVLSGVVATVVLTGVVAGEVVVVVVVLGLKVAPVAEVVIVTGAATGVLPAGAVVVRIGALLGVSPMPPLTVVSVFAVVPASWVPEPVLAPPELSKRVKTGPVEVVDLRSWFTPNWAGEVPLYFT